MGNANEAHRRSLEEVMICAHCGAMNRPGVRYIELTTVGLAICEVCGHAWRVDLTLAVTDVQFLRETRIAPA